MKITLIGGSGFIGSNLLHILNVSNYQCSNLDKNQSKHYPSLTTVVDVCEAQQLQRQLTPCDLVMLLAAEHRDDISPTLYEEVNVQGTRNVLQAMDERSIRKIIFTSSVAIYGLNKDAPNEQHLADPFNAYGKSKWQAEEVLRSWYSQDSANRTLIIIRPTVVFGPGNRGNVYNLLYQIAAGKFLMIGNGKNKKSMAYVENVAGFLKYCIDQDFTGYRVYNYVDKPDLSMRELVSVAENAMGKTVPAIRVPYWLGYLGGTGFDLLAKISGKQLPISAIRVRKFCATTQFSADAMRATGYQAPYTLKQGIQKTIQSILNSNHQISNHQIDCPSFVQDQRVTTCNFFKK